jgi:hypothetical protein
MAADYTERRRLRRASPDDRCSLDDERRFRRTVINPARRRVPVRVDAIDAAGPIVTMTAFAAAARR